MSSELGSAHIAIVPSMKGFKSSVSKGVGSACRSAGASSGKTLGSSLKSAFSKSSKGLSEETLAPFRRDVAKATSQLSKARSKMADDAGRVRVAEMRLADAVAKSGEGSTRAVAAGERLASARRRLEASSSACKGAEDRLKAASDALKSAQDSAASSTSKLSSALKKVASFTPAPLKSAATAIGGSFRPLATGAVSHLKGIGNAVVGLLPNAVVSGFSRAFSGASAIVGRAMGGVRGAVASVASYVPSALSGMSAAAGAALSGLVSAAAAVGAALAAAMGSGVKAYSSWEQLVGGVDTLFKDASAAVQANADKAYMTAGVSANRYMEQVTSFSASLIQSLGGDTQRAAEMADMAVRDMSDNANKMGTDIQTVQETYQSLARGNYAMLDNLKLGYGGTKSEMERLIAKANELKAANGEAGDLAVDSYADIVEAIHLVQDEMGITGTTAKEAATTIEGSVNSAKAAFSNWVAGLGKDGADMAALTDQMVDAVAVAAGNVVPRVGQIADTLLRTVSDRATAWLDEGLPSVLESFIAWCESSMPAFMEGGAGMLGGLAEGIVENIPLLLEAAGAAVTGFMDGISAQLPALVPLAMQALLNFVAGVAQNLPAVVAAGVKMLGALVQGVLDSIPLLLQQAPAIIGSFVSAVLANLPQIIAAGVTMLVNLGVGLVQAIPQLIGQIPAIISSVASEFTSYDWGSVGMQIINGIKNGLTGAARSLCEAAANAAGDAINWVKDKLGIHSPSRVARDQIGKMIPAGIGEGIERGTPGLITRAQRMAERAVGAARIAASGWGAKASPGLAAAGAGAGGQTFIFNQPVQSPDEFARAVRRADRHGPAAAF